MAKTYKILVVDEDQPTLQKVYISLLLKEYKVEATCDGNEVVARIQRFQPHLIIVNKDIPGLDGTEICTLVKSEFDIPIILLMEQDSASTIQIDSCDADAILNKPVDRQELFSKNQRIVSPAPAVICINSRQLPYKMATVFMSCIKVSLNYCQRMVQQIIDNSLEVEKALSIS